MKSVWILIFALIFTSDAYSASCPRPQFANSKKINLPSQSLLVVTHPSTLWDGRFASKAGMDATVAYAKKNKIPVVYLQDDDPQTDPTYYFADCHPDYWVTSYGGEFRFDVKKVTHFYSVGGHLELCQETTLKSLMNQWKNRKESLTLTQVMEGIYLYGGKVFPEDPYYQDFHRFIQIVSYKNPRDPWFVEKLSLIEMMGIIKTESLQIDFLKRNLPNYSQLPYHRVELVVNNVLQEVLQKGIGKNPPVLKLEFIDNLYQNSTLIPSSPAKE